MIRPFKWWRCKRQGAPAAALEKAGGVKVPRTRRRHVTVENLFFIAMLVIAAFLFARQQGLFLDSPSVQPGNHSERNVVAPDFILPDLGGRPIRFCGQCFLKGIAMPRMVRHLDVGHHGVRWRECT
jgi:hypothetical protein